MDNETPTLYITGPFRNVDDCVSWRLRVIDVYGGLFDVIDPLQQYGIAPEDMVVVPDDDPRRNDVDVVTHSEIVETGKEMIRDADAVLVGYKDVTQIRTSMEVLFAYELNCPIVVWIRDETDESNLEPAYQHHADKIKTNLPAAVTGIKQYTGFTRHHTLKQGEE